MGKGVTLSREELLALKELLDTIDLEVPGRTPKQESYSERGVQEQPPPVLPQMPKSGIWGKVNVEYG